MHISAKLNAMEKRTMSQVDSSIEAMRQICYAIDNNMASDLVLKDKNISLFRWVNEGGESKVMKMLGDDKIQVGNVFSTRSRVIVHGVNCMGVMGAGIAAQIRRNFPKAYSEYIKFINECRIKQESPLGKAQFVDVGGGNYIVNAFTQEKTAKKQGDVAISYSAILMCMEEIKETCYCLGIDRIAMPKIGSDLGGGDWNIIRSIINAVFNDSRVEVTVYVLPSAFLKNASTKF